MPDRRPTLPTRPLSDRITRPLARAIAMRVAFAVGSVRPASVMQEHADSNGTPSRSAMGLVSFAGRSD